MSFSKKSKKDINDFSKLFAFGASKKLEKNPIIKILKDEIKDLNENIRQEKILRDTVDGNVLPSFYPLHDELITHAVKGDLITTQKGESKSISPEESKLSEKKTISIGEIEILKRHNNAFIKFNELLPERDKIAGQLEKHLILMRPVKNIEARKNIEFLRNLKKIHNQAKILLDQLDIEAINDTPNKDNIVNLNKELKKVSDLREKEIKKFEETQEKKAEPPIVIELRKQLENIDKEIGELYKFLSDNQIERLNRLGKLSINEPKKEKLGKLSINEPKKEKLGKLSINEPKEEKLGKLSINEPKESKESKEEEEEEDIEKLKEPKEKLKEKQSKLIHVSSFDRKNINKNLNFIFTTYKNERDLTKGFREILAFSQDSRHMIFDITKNKLWNPMGSKIYYLSINRERAVVFNQTLINSIILFLNNYIETNDIKIAENRKNKPKLLQDSPNIPGYILLVFEGERPSVEISQGTDLIQESTEAATTSSSVSVSGAGLIKSSIVKVTDNKGKVIRTFKKTLGLQKLLEEGYDPKFKYSISDISAYVFIVLYEKKGKILAPSNQFAMTKEKIDKIIVPYIINNTSKVNNLDTLDVFFHAYKNGRPELKGKLKTSVRALRKKGFFTEKEMNEILKKLN